MTDLFSIDLCMTVATAVGAVAVLAWRNARRRTGGLTYQAITCARQNQHRAEKRR